MPRLWSSRWPQRWLTASGRFSDVETGHPRYADIEYAASQGWSVRYDDCTFRPPLVIPEHQIASVVARVFPDGATRADMATFLRGGEERLVRVPQHPLVLQPGRTRRRRPSSAGGLGVTADGIWGRGTEPRGWTNAPLTSIVNSPPAQAFCRRLAGPSNRHCSARP